MARQFDCILSGGTVFDGVSAEGRRADVGILDGRIDAVADRLDPVAERIVDCTGRLVCPGLIDLHAHVFDGVSVWGVAPQDAGIRTGVTTVVDAGTAGSTTFPGFRRYFIEPARTEVLAYLHVVTIGILTSDRSGVIVSELSDPNYLDPGGAAATVEANRDVLVGIKVRLTATYTADEKGETKALDAALEAAERAKVPLMVHHTGSRITMAEMMDKLRPGDVYTHCFHSREPNIVDDRLKLMDCVRQAREKGVCFDVGHGVGSFDWPIARACAEQGFWPDVISTDLHRYNIDGPVFDLPTTLSKFVHLGMPIGQAIAAATSRPAEAVGRAERIGRLAEGRRADVTVLEVVEGDHQLTDSAGRDERASIRLVPRCVLREGLVCTAGDRYAPPADER